MVRVNASYHAMQKLERESINIKSFVEISDIFPDLKDQEDGSSSSHREEVPLLLRAPDWNYPRRGSQLGQFSEI